MEEGFPVVAIALAYQENPLAWIVKHDNNISKPSDLRGRNVGLTFIDDKPLFGAMLRHAGLSERDLTIVPVKFDPSPFVSGQVDAYPVFRNTQGVEISKSLEQHQTATNFISPAQVGIVSYSNLYFTTKKYLKAHRPVVEAFVKGVLAGWGYAQEDPKDAARIVAKYDKGNSLEIVEASVRETNRLVKPRPDTSIGLMTLQGWDQTQDVLLKAGELKKRVDLEDVFTNDFVK